MTQDYLAQITAGIEPDAVRDTIERCFKGQISPAIAVTLLLIQTKQIESTARVLSVLAHRASLTLTATPEPCRKATKMQRLLWENYENCVRIVSMLRGGLSTNEQACSVEEGIRFVSSIFDWAVLQLEEASVALYSLGNRELLDQATEEVVELLNKWELLHPECVMLDIGCGIGRFEQALAARVKQIHGIDVSANMVEVAKRRCAAHSNVHLSTCSGQDLGLFATNSFDLVMAVDSFPYIHQAGASLVEKHFEEVARVLREGGDFVLLNFSYRSDLEADQAEITRLAAAHGFKVLVNGIKPFTLWDGQAWRLRVGIG